ncbi:flavin reductase family protein [Streptomyces sp. NRRL S-87]|uniref:flavin reductase family protein n=1 Tax=Streptomyces sp. NRRL S-87 TaxID=1463920 RepID=UPI000A535F87|nr:flavin reductase family protein [Streptomyces sp. NRRL S-87]
MSTPVTPHASPPAAPDVDPRALRTALGQFASGVTVVATSDGAAVHGATVSSFTSVSLDPPLVLVSLDRRSRSCARLADAPFGVNVLAAGQRDLALLFAGAPGRAAGAGSAWPRPEPRWEGDPRAPRLAGSAAYFGCVPWAAYDGGDHVLYVGRVVRFDAPGGEPLVFHSGALGGFRRPAAAATAAWTGSLDGPAHGWTADFGALGSARTA